MKEHKKIHFRFGVSFFLCVCRKAITAPLMIFGWVGEGGGKKTCYRLFWLSDFSFLSSFLPLFLRFLRPSNERRLEEAELKIWVVLFLSPLPSYIPWECKKKGESSEVRGE